MGRRLDRWKIQALATIASNPVLVNFIDGKLYKGKLKSLCVPGLNCYSCPGAIGSCPIGSIQAVTGSPKFKLPFYVFGLLIIFATILGRYTCGFLCPFGWFQELIYKIPSKKISTKALKYFTYLKYVILVFFVILLPMVIVDSLGIGEPYFCKYICPVGILEGAIPISAVNQSVRSSVGWLFTWKSFVLLSIITLSVFFYRPFCKWLCPLGAIYAIFNKISLYTIKVDHGKCVNCNQCSKACKMDVEVVKNPNSPECIRCGDCAEVCHFEAIKIGFDKKERI